MPTLPSISTVALQTSESAPVLPEPAPVQNDPDPDGWVPTEAIDGQVVSTVRRYYPSGKVRRIYTHKKGMEGPLGQHGRDLSLHENGAWSQEAQWVDGHLQGPYKEWFEGGQLRVESAFVGGLRHGTFREYGGRGALRIQGEYRKGRLHGAFKQWFGTGDPQEESHWENGVQTGTRRVWDRQITPIVSEAFANGVRHGETIVYHRYPGEEKIHQIGNYRRGAKQGVWMEFTPDGAKVQEKEFVEGKVSGYFREWKEGVLTLDTHYVNNVENGLRLEFYANGEPFSKGTMKDAGREGVWLYWKEDGSLQSKWSGIYKDSKKVSELPEEETPRE